MKFKILLVLSLLLVSIKSYAGRMDNQSDIFSVGNVASSETTRIDGYGALIPGANIRFDLGYATHAWRNVHGSSVAVDQLYVTTVTYRVGAQTLSAGTATIPSASFMVLTSTQGPIIITATPSITTGTVRMGVVLHLINSTTNTITFQDDNTLTDSRLELGATTRALAENDTLCLVYNSLTGRWLETCFVNND